MSVLPRQFYAKTSTTTGCVLWVGAINSVGYGQFWLDGVSHLAHRLAYESVNGPIPEGMTVDHICRVRQCVNPEHLEVVTRGENARRAETLIPGRECRRGHLISSPADIYVYGAGKRECRTCLTLRSERVNAERRQERALARAAQ